MTERPKVPDSKSGVPQGTRGSNPLLSAEQLRGVTREARRADEGGGDLRLQPVCTPAPDHVAVLEAAIDRLTRMLGTAPDDVIPELVAERKVMREEMLAIRASSSRVQRLRDGRATRSR